MDGKIRDGHHESKDSNIFASLTARTVFMMSKDM